MDKCTISDSIRCGLGGAGLHCYSCAVMVDYVEQLCEGHKFPKVSISTSVPDISDEILKAKCHHNAQLEADRKATKFRDEKEAELSRMTMTEANGLIEDALTMESTRVLLNNAGLKYDQGKPQLDLIPHGTIEAIGEVLTYGAEKYEAYSWMHVEDNVSRYTSALMRHLEAWRSGEKDDDESGLSHLKHVLCNAAFLLWLEENQDA